MAYAYTGAVFAAPVEERIARPSALARFFTALAESRVRAAGRHLRARGYLVDETGLVLGDAHRARLGTDSRLPFAR